MAEDDGRTSLPIPASSRISRAFDGRGSRSRQVLEQVARGMAWETIVKNGDGKCRNQTIGEDVILVMHAFVEHVDEYVVETDPSMTILLSVRQE